MMTFLFVGAQLLLLQGSDKDFLEHFSFSPLLFELVSHSIQKYTLSDMNMERA